MMDALPKISLSVFAGAVFLLGVLGMSLVWAAWKTPPKANWYCEDIPGAVTCGKIVYGPSGEKTYVPLAGPGAKK